VIGEFRGFARIASIAFRGVTAATSSAGGRLRIPTLIARRPVIIIALERAANAVDGGVEVVEDDDMIPPGLRVVRRYCSTEARKRSPLIAPSNGQGVSIRSWRSAARKVVVFQTT